MLLYTGSEKFAIRNIVVLIRRAMPVTCTLMVGMSNTGLVNYGRLFVARVVYFVGCVKKFDFLEDVVQLLQWIANEGAAMSRTLTMMVITTILAGRADQAPVPGNLQSADTQLRAFGKGV